ncbi:acetylglutamate kinase [Megalodesulfovibrio gigas]|uniref:Acetylglutamate kinase n=1 Tax=Megalodesulfovibrio gigas (strain ATCC 19364 / DSM 1382 / NCIMB 9332 / VKM B-1759) TaxID=1121448 RepID=T2GD78_MEGG1|nr:acetylglutamate kinase [Megalodesulfovibrio gigas]AGW13877.1 putative acetylglutamate kinase [Megalodesulfovibrio gigas DSM 1382 = ATCC 19364]
MEKGARIARMLMESLPFIRQFHGQTLVIKYGGHAMKDEVLKSAFARSMVMLKYIGINPVVVHGGGPQIGQLLQKLCIPTTFREGLRVTDRATMDVVEMVLGGKVNKEIVSLLNLHGGKAVGLSGMDGWLLKVRRMELAVDRENAPPEIIDLGHVGEPVAVETALIRSVERDGFIPVIAPLGVDEEGKSYNVNADSAAGAIASAMKAKRLILLTDVPGILDKSGQLISSLTLSQAALAIADGTVSGGMIPKVKCCMEALDAGVEKAHIIDGRLENAVLLELFTTGGIGTEIVRTK